MKFFNSLNKNEKGTAVIIALGIFALILALGLNFASQSIINEKVAQNLGDKTKSEIFIHSSQSRILAEIAATSDLSTLYSIDPNGGNDTPGDQLSTTIENINYQGSPNAQWIYIYNSSEPDNTDSEIIGRIAYSLCTAGCSNDDPDSMNYSGLGKLNAAACVDSGINAAILGSGFFAVSENDIINTSLNTSGTPVQGRPGVDVNEIYLAALDPAFTDQALQKISAENISTGNGRLPVFIPNSDPQTPITNGGNWLDFSTLLTDIGVDTSSAGIETRNRIAKKLTTSSVPDPEAFWIDLNDDDLVSDTDEMFHRFNLTRNDWDTLTVSSFIDTTPDTLLYPDSNYSDASMTCIPWIKNWQFPGTDTVSDTMRRQITANLIDYNDTDNNATTNYPTVNPPTYIGLEKVPYINEVKLTFRVMIYKVFGMTFGLFRFSDIDIELVNMYNTDLTAKATVLLDYSFTFDGDVYNSSTLFSPPTTTIITANESSYSTGNEGNDNYDFLFKLDGDDGEITDFKINSLIVRLNSEDDDDLYDYSLLIDTTSTPSQSILDNYKVVYYDFQVNDPRQNLNEYDWNFSSSNGTIGGQNSNYDPLSGDVDPEDDGSVEPWNISTAYIRNATMKSPWELGFIHRAAAWQTLNLKKYNSINNSGALKTSGGNEYDNGDANILDQIKMTSNTTTLGKVNLNNPISDDENNPLIALFTGISVGVELNDSTDNPGYSATAETVSAENASTLSTAIQGEIITNNTLDKKEMYKTRAQVLKNREEFTDDSLDNLTQITDATQEEIIGKFINLTKADGKLYNTDNLTVLLIAQTIKDIGGKTKDLKINGIYTRKGRFDTGADNVLSTTKALVRLSKNPTTNKWIVERFDYIGE